MMKEITPATYFGSLVKCSVCDILLHTLSTDPYSPSLVSLHKHNRSFVNMPPPNRIIKDSKQHHAAVHGTRPVHIDRRDRLCQRPEQEEPERDRNA